MTEQLTIEIGPKLLAYVATLIYTGAAVFLALVRRGELGADSGRSRVAGSARRLATVAAVAAVLALLLRAAAHAVLVAGSAAELTADTLRLVTLESRWGGGWRWQLLAAVASAFAARRAHRTAGVPLLLFAAVFWCIATPALGHGASTLWQRVVHAGHIGASGAWLGTVIVLAWCLGTTDVSARLIDLQAVVRRFSPWALTAAAAVALTGLLLGFTYVGTIEALWTTAYGRWLVAKLLAVGGLVVCGLLNWRRSQADRPPSAGLIRAEALLALLVLALTTMLSETEYE